MLLIDGDVAATDGVGRKCARFVKANGPEIFVESRRFGGRIHFGEIPVNHASAQPFAVYRIGARNFSFIRYISKE